MLQRLADVSLVGEAGSGDAAIELIARSAPDLALLDLHMPQIDGLEVARRLAIRHAHSEGAARHGQRPLIAFVTAFDNHAVQAFEMNVVDYLLKPVDQERLHETINRVRERLEWLAKADSNPSSTTETWLLAGAVGSWLERIPIRRRDDIILLPIREIASIIADGELLRLTTIRNERFTINHRLRDLESRLDPARFIRLSRGTIANIELLQRMSPLPGGTYLATLGNGQQLQVSRQQGRLIRESLLKL